MKKRPSDSPPPSRSSKLQEGVDFYLNDQGLMVLTAAFLLKRGFCCQSGCLHCPYGYRQKADPHIPAEWQNVWTTPTEEEVDLSQYEEMEEEFYQGLENDPQTTPSRKK